MRWMRRRIRRPRRVEVEKWREEVGRLFGSRNAADAAGAEPQAVRRDVLAVAPAVRRSRGRRRNGSAPDALRHLRRAGRLLPARRVRGRHDVHRSVRLPRFTLARLRLQSRPRAADDQHHSRRQGRSDSRGASICRRKISRGSASPSRRWPAASMTGACASCWRMNASARGNFYTAAAQAMPHEEVAQAGGRGNHGRRSTSRSSSASSAAATTCSPSAFACRSCSGRASRCRSGRCRSCRRSA